jgi:hypothetical protein
LYVDPFEPPRSLVFDHGEMACPAVTTHAESVSRIAAQLLHVGHSFI